MRHLSLSPHAGFLLVDNCLFTYRKSGGQLILWNADGASVLTVEAPESAEAMLNIVASPVIE